LSIFEINGISLRNHEVPRTFRSPDLMDAAPQVSQKPGFQHEASHDGEGVLDEPQPASRDERAATAREQLP
jgi:hypothetical protein